MRWLMFLVLLAGCASHAPSDGYGVAASSSHPGLTCVPFARALTGIAIAGDAADWWAAAPPRYARSSRPRVGAVLVFRRAPRLPSGHVSVVSQLLDARRINVIQANWVPGQLYTDQLVVDVSGANDWSEVRVWYPPAGQLGSHTYAIYGFILPPTPLTHDALAQRAEPAARAVTGG